jgi:hypothetical protein
LSPINGAVEAVVTKGAKVALVLGEFDECCLGLALLQIVLADAGGAATEGLGAGDKVASDGPRSIGVRRTAWGAVLSAPGMLKRPPGKPKLPGGLLKAVWSWGMGVRPAPAPSPLAEGLGFAFLRMEKKPQVVQASSAGSRLPEQPSCVQGVHSGSPPPNMPSCSVVVAGSFFECAGLAWAAACARAVRTLLKAKDAGNV